MEQLVDVVEFLSCRDTHVLLDVRSPGEYEHGHIPGALSFPLFSNEERAEVGTLYKQVSKEAAMLEGLRIVGPKMAEFVERAMKLAPKRRLAIHCWRGGQRSQSMAWLFRQAGFEVLVLEGGYKKYRRYVLDAFEQIQLPLIIVGGKTGTGKTKILHALKNLGEQIIDLEALAHHKGSAFGSIGEAPQPEVEQFENNLYEVLSQLEPGRRVWVENESQSIGRIFIPLDFWEKMKLSPIFNIQIPQEARIRNLIEDYTGVSASELEAAFRRIERKLGGQHLKAALEALQQDDYATAAEIALKYYDKTYLYGLENNTAPEVRAMPFDTGAPEFIARQCLLAADEAGYSGGKPVPLNLPNSGLFK